MSEFWEWCQTQASNWHFWLVLGVWFVAGEIANINSTLGELHRTIRRIGSKK